MINQGTLSILALICTVAAFFIGQYTGIKRKGYEQGVKDAKLDSLGCKLDKLVDEIKEWNMGGLIQRIVALEKHVFKREDL